jgi:hypothetical protein
VPVACRESRFVPGVQIADAVSQAVFRSLGTNEDAAACRRAVGQLEASGQVRITRIELAELRPAWLPAEVT